MVRRGTRLSQPHTPVETKGVRDEGAEDAEEEEGSVHEDVQGELLASRYVPLCVPRE
jgi:hypothetical protein